MLTKSKLSGARATSILKNILRKKLKEQYLNLNNCKDYSDFVPWEVYMLDEDILPSQISATDILDEIDVLLDNKTNKSSLLKLRSHSNINLITITKKEQYHGTEQNIKKR